MEVQISSGFLSKQLQLQKAQNKNKNVFKERLETGMERINLSSVGSQ